MNNVLNDLANLQTPSICLLPVCSSGSSIHPRLVGSIERYRATAHTLSLALYTNIAPPTKTLKVLFEEDQAREIASAKIWNIYLKSNGNDVDDYSMEE